MPVKRTCSFCAGDIEPGTGYMFVKRDGSMFYFCSSSCRKQQLGLGRVGHRLRWTRAHELKRLAEHRRQAPTVLTTVPAAAPPATPPVAAKPIAKPTTARPTAAGRKPPTRPPKAKKAPVASGSGEPKVPAPSESPSAEAKAPKKGRAPKPAEKPDPSSQSSQ